MPASVQVQDRIKANFKQTKRWMNLLHHFLTQLQSSITEPGKNSKKDNNVFSVVVCTQLHTAIAILVRLVPVFPAPLKFYPVQHQSDCSPDRPAMKTGKAPPQFSTIS